MDLKTISIQIQREVKKLLIVSITSNRGLCGGFNSYIIKSVKNIIEKQKTI